MKSIFSLLILFLFTSFAIAQETKPAYWDDIQKFKKQDSIAMPEKKQILFIGSSSFTKWTDAQTYFPSYKILNRGFGGSALTDVIRYAEDVIFKYDPKQIIIYCGENDFVAKDSPFPVQVAERFFTLFKLIRERYKKVPIAFISLKPSPSRQYLIPKFNVANVMIKSFLKNKKRAKFIDIYHSMLDENGVPLKDIYLTDNLHLNAKGYAIWQKIITPYLKK
jgi:pentatricopeptide repeat protein